MKRGRRIPISDSDAYRIRRLSREDPSDREIWREFSAAAHHRQPFSSLAYADAVSEAFGHPCTIIAAEDTDEIVAGTLVFENSLGPYRIAAVPPFTAYTPLLLKEHPRETDINHRRSPVGAVLAALEERYHRLSLLLPPSVDDVRPYTWRGWEVSPLYTYHVPLREPETALQDWSKTRRYDYRTHRGEYEIEERTSSIEPLIRLCAESYQRSDRALPGGVSNVVALVETLLSRDIARAFAAVSKSSGEPEAGIISLSHGDIAYYWLAGSTPGPAMTVLLGRVCEILYEDGFSTLDLVGANTPSIAEFKRRFGSVLVPYHHATRTLRPELRFVDLLRSLRG